MGLVISASKLEDFKKVTGLDKDEIINKLYELKCSYDKALEYFITFGEWHSVELSKYLKYLSIPSLAVLTSALTNKKSLLEEIQKAGAAQVKEARMYRAQPKPTKRFTYLTFDSKAGLVQYVNKHNITPVSITESGNCSTLYFYEKVD